MSINEKTIRFDDAGREIKTNPYYIKISHRLRFVKYMLLIILTVYIAFMLSVFRGSITYDNLMYLLRDFNSSPAGEGMFSSVDFVNEDCSSVKFFRGELASAGKSLTALYSYSGKPSFEYDKILSDPMIDCSDKYMLVYDFGGNSYSLYTSVARVLDAESEGKIISADVCRSGEFLIAEKSKESKFKVTVYDTSFRPVARYHKKNYLTSAVLSPDGKNVIMSSLDISGTDMITSVEMYRIGDEEIKAQYSEIGVFPFGIEIFDNGAFILKTSDSIVYFDSDGNNIKNVSYKNGYVICKSDGKNVMIVTEKSGVLQNAELYLYDSEGNEKFSADVDFVPEYADLSSDAVYLLKADRADKITFEAQKETLKLDIEASGIVSLGKYAFVYNSARGMSVFN